MESGQKKEDSMSQPQKQSEDTTPKKIKAETPEEFYRRIVRLPSVKSILEQLAKK